MNLKSTFFAIIMLLSLSFLVACNNSTKVKQLQDSVQAIKQELETKSSQAKIVEAIYESCTVYAGSTKFFFKPAQGELIEVSILNKGMEDEELYRIKMPNNLVDDSQNLEGPPGANHKMVGKKFQLIYNDKNEVVEIKPL